MSITPVQTNNRRKLKRYVNKVVHRFNKVIANDTLWRGRFEARIESIDYHTYSDGCVELYFFYYFIDKATKNKSEIFGESVWGIPHIFANGNEVIVNKFQVWQNSPDPRIDKTDYRKITVNLKDYALNPAHYAGGRYFDEYLGGRK